MFNILKRFGRADMRVIEREMESGREGEKNVTFLLFMITISHFNALNKRILNNYTFYARLGVFLLHFGIFHCN